MSTSRDFSSCSTTTSCRHRIMGEILAEETQCRSQVDTKWLLQPLTTEEVRHAFFSNGGS